MFPVNLNLAGRRAVVFGAGKVAERRAVKLLEAGAEVMVIGREITDNLNRLKNERLKLIKEEINKKDIRGYISDSDIVLIATDDMELNDTIERACKEEGKLVNRSDKVSDFVIPASLEVGGINIAISTKGKSPAVTKLLKKRIRKVITEEDVLSLELEAFLRERLKFKIVNQEKRKEILRDILNKPEVISYIMKGDLEGAKRTALK